MKLKQLRLETKLNQTKTAELLGIPRINYNKYENEEVEPSIETMIRIADYYNVSLDYLCDRTTKYDLPALTTEQIELVKSITQLNNINLLKTTCYVAGLLTAQN